MKRNRQSPAYARFARHCCLAAEKFDIGVISAIRLMVLLALACGSNSEVNISTAPGGAAHNFERLRETKDLSAICPLVLPPAATFQGI
jgi:hypothetical protein